MTTTDVWHLTLAIVVVVSFFAGGAPERLTALVMLAASMLTRLFFLVVGYVPIRSFHLDIFLIDGGVQLFLVLLALKANRFWPIYASIVHSIELLAHLSILLAPTIRSGIYQRAPVAGAYLTLACLLIGTLRHQWRLWKLQTDPDWSS